MLGHYQEQDYLILDAHDHFFTKGKKITKINYYVYGINFLFFITNLIKYKFNYFVIIKKILVNQKISIQELVKMMIIIISSTNPELPLFCFQFLLLLLGFPLDAFLHFLSLTNSLIIV